MAQPQTIRTKLAGVSLLARSGFIPTPPDVPNYNIFVGPEGDTVILADVAGAEPIKRKPRTSAKKLFDLINKRSAAIGWGRFADGDQVIFVYDKADDNFGYTFNLDWPDGDEWSYVYVGEGS